MYQLCWCAMRMNKKVVVFAPESPFPYLSISLKLGLQAVHKFQLTKLNLYKGLEMRHEGFDPQPLKHLWTPALISPSGHSTLHCSPYTFIRKFIWSDLKHLVANPEVFTDTRSHKSITSLDHSIVRSSDLLAFTTFQVGGHVPFIIYLPASSLSGIFFFDIPRN